MNIEDMTLKEIESRKAELNTECNSATEERLAEIKDEMAKLNERKAELEATATRKNTAEMLENGTVQPDKIVERSTAQKEAKKMSKLEERAKFLVENGKMTLETRQLLAAGTLRPDAVKDDIGELPSVVSSIVDDVNAVMVSGIGAYKFAYQATEASAAAVTDGSAIGGTGATFATGTISPDTWGIVDTISRLVSKESPLAYEQAIKNAAVLALRKKAKATIAANVIADTYGLTEAKTYTLDKDFVRNLVLGFDADESVNSEAKLYLCKEDLATLGAVRGTNEKKAVFDIQFTDSNNGTIVDGGMAVKFSILSDLQGKGASSGNGMFYGQPKAITMPLWGDYEIATDEGGKYFEANLTAVRGLQTAGAGLTRKGAMQKINF